jgi:hypothetical protein
MKWYTWIPLFVLTIIATHMADKTHYEKIYGVAGAALPTSKPTSGGGIINTTPPTVHNTNVYHPFKFSQGAPPPPGNKFDWHPLGEIPGVNAWRITVDGKTTDHPTREAANQQLSQWGWEIRLGPPPDTGFTAWITRVGGRIWDAL